MIKATFENIRQQITELISDSKESIQISVAWFTSQDLLGQLIEKVERGCVVEIIISDHFENKRLSFEKFTKLGGQVFILPTKSGKFLHDKFAIFDTRKVISGSYNWTNSAEFYNHELLVISDDSDKIENAFDINLEENQAWLKGVMSRKKQIIPFLEKQF